MALCVLEYAVAGVGFIVAIKGMIKFNRFGAFSFEHGMTVGVGVIERKSYLPVKKNQFECWMLKIFRQWVLQSGVSDAVC